MRRALLIVLAAGCYRDTAKPIVNTTAQDRSLVAASCGGQDDLDVPPLDVQGGRLRYHVHGVLSGPTGRTWAGGRVPDYVPQKLGTLELFLLDEADGGYLAFYREPYDLGSCQLRGNLNCAYRARFYDRGGEQRWELDLGALMSRGNNLEVQDIRLASGVLYFNEACQSYSNEANGQCSSLVAVDPRKRQVLWRTAPLTSNGRFRVRGCYIIAGYGFTAEPDFVYLVDRHSGSVLQKLFVSSSPEALTLVGRDRLDVGLYSGITRKFRLDGMDSGNGTMVALDADPYGGAGYGGRAYGGSYGGATYGQLPGP